MSDRDQQSRRCSAGECDGSCPSCSTRRIGGFEAIRDQQDEQATVSSDITPSPEWMDGYRAGMLEGNAEGERAATERIIAELERVCLWSDGSSRTVQGFMVVVAAQQAGKSDAIERGEHE